MNVDFWFDPVCPFCWVTSRWLNDVAPQRDLTIEWQPISLLFQNDPPPDSSFYEPNTRTRNLLRVVESVRAAGQGDRIGDLYTEFGRHIHNREELDFDVAAVLDNVGLDPAHADALDDETYDKAIRVAMEDGFGLTGEDVGTPLIAITTPEAGRVGLFGPIISVKPEGDDALRLWDGFVAMVSTPSFYELKRTRDQAPQPPPEDSL